MTVLLEPDSAAHTSAIGFFVKTGTRDEDRPLMGVSHFLEHMMFKSTVGGRTGDDINREFDEMGANYNAYTSQEMTVYYAHVLPEFQFKVMNLLADMFQPRLTDRDFELERPVILEEIGMYDDQPHWRLSNLAHEKYYGAHPMGFPVLGTKESINAMTAARMRDYFKANYGPDAITFVATGNIDTDRLVSELDAFTASWKNEGNKRKYTPIAFNFGRQAFYDGKLNRHYLQMYCPGPSAQCQERYTARIIADVLGDSEGSRLYWALVDPGIAEEATFGFEPQDRTGMFMANLLCDPDRAEEAESILLKTLDDYGRSIDDAEITRAKSKIATEVMLQDESTMGRLGSIGNSWVYQGRCQSLEEEMRMIQSVTPEMIRDLLARWPLDRRLVCTLSPG
jgi:predicted Zn-dependent peptidase